jgi:hypothetical protein
LQKVTLVRKSDGSVGWLSINPRLLPRFSLGEIVTVQVRGQDAKLRIGFGYGPDTIAW